MVPAAGKQAAAAAVAAVVVDMAVHIEVDSPVAVRMQDVHKEEDTLDAGTVAHKVQVAHRDLVARTAVARMEPVADSRKEAWLVVAYMVPAFEPATTKCSKSAPKKRYIYRLLPLALNT